MFVASLYDLVTYIPKCCMQYSSAFLINTVHPVHCTTERSSLIVLNFCLLIKLCSFANTGIFLMFDLTVAYYENILWMFNLFQTMPQTQITRRTDGTAYRASTSSSTTRLMGKYKLSIHTACTGLHLVLMV